jgi:hypothetical protein
LRWDRVWEFTLRQQMRSQESGVRRKMVAAGSCLGIHSQAGNEESGVRSQEKNGCGRVAHASPVSGSSRIQRNNQETEILGAFLLTPDS